MSHNNSSASTNNTFSFGILSNILANTNNTSNTITTANATSNNTNTNKSTSSSATTNPWIFESFLNGNRKTSSIHQRLMLAIHFYFLFVFCFSFCLLCTAENFTLSTMTLASPVASFAAGVSDNILYTFDGTSTDTEYHAPFDYILSSSVSWLSQSIPEFYFGGYSSPTVIYFYGQSVLQIGEIVYCLFPSTQNLKYRVMLKYSLNNNSYFGTDTYYAVRNNDHGSSTCATFNSPLNIIYSVGWYYAEFYNISNDSWAYISDPNQLTKVSGCAMDINSQYIFKFGGLNSTSYVDIVEKYDVSSDNWVILSNVTLKQLMYGLKCILYKNVDNKIYCTGGSYNSEYLPFVHVFDPESLTIDFVSYQLNEKRSSHRMILYDQCIIAIGGWVGSSVYLDSIEYLCLKPPSDSPSASPTTPSSSPTMLPSLDPSTIPSQSPTNDPVTNHPTMLPSFDPSSTPTKLPTHDPTTYNPSSYPTLLPSTIQPSTNPSAEPSNYPTILPTDDPTMIPTIEPTILPSFDPSKPSATPTEIPTNDPITDNPSNDPTVQPSGNPTTIPSKPPTNGPSTDIPSNGPTILPSNDPSNTPTKRPTNDPISTKTIVISKDSSTEFILSTAVSILGCLLIAVLVYVCWRRYRKRRKAETQNVFTQATKGGMNEFPKNPLQIQMALENKNVNNNVVQNSGDLNMSGRNFMLEEEFETRY